VKLSFIISYYYQEKCLTCPQWI